MRITMNRPDALNALDPQLVNALRDTFNGLYWRPEIRIVVLAGEGRAFCAGLDLKRERDVTQRSVTRALEDQRRISEIVMAMRRCPQPIIGLIDGPATGGGFALALASDIRIATPRTK